MLKPKVRGNLKVLILLELNIVSFQPRSALINLLRSQQGEGYFLESCESKSSSLPRLEVGRDDRSADSLQVGAAGRGRVHLHRGEQRGQARVLRLPRGRDQAPRGAAVQQDLRHRQGGRHPHLQSLRGPLA